MTHADAKAMIIKLIPEVFSESRYQVPKPRLLVDAYKVFDTIREQCEPVMTTDEFNAIVDGDIPVADGWVDP